MSSEPGGEAPSLLKGGAITFWDGVHCFSSLQIEEMDLVPKRWGIFQLADSRDIVIHGCRIRAEAAALTSCFEEIGQTLCQIARSGLQPIDYQGRQAAPALLPLPPRIEVHNFSCILSQPEGRSLTISADLATFEPPEAVLALEGRVRVVSAQGSVLQAEALDWLPLREKIQVKTGYKFSRRQGKPGRLPAWFSLAGGHLKRSQAPRPDRSSDPGPAAALSPDLMVAAATGNSPAHHRNKWFSLMFPGPFQAQAPPNLQPFPTPASSANPYP